MLVVNGHLPNGKLREESQGLLECLREKLGCRKGKLQESVEIDSQGTQSPVERVGRSASLLLPSPLWQSADCYTVGKPLCPHNPRQCYLWRFGNSWEMQNHVASSCGHAVLPTRPEPRWQAPHWWCIHGGPLLCAGFFCPWVTAPPNPSQTHPTTQSAFGMHRGLAGHWVIQPWVWTTPQGEGNKAWENPSWDKENVGAAPVTEGGSTDAWEQTWRKGALLPHPHLCCGCSSGYLSWGLAHMHPESSPLFVAAPCPLKASLYIKVWAQLPLRTQSSSNAGQTSPRVWTYQHCDWETKDKVFMNWGSWVLQQGHYREADCGPASSGWGTGATP